MGKAVLPGVWSNEKSSGIIRVELWFKSQRTVYTIISNREVVATERLQIRISAGTAPRLVFFLLYMSTAKRT